MFKESRNIIEDENRPGSPTTASTPEIVDSVDVLILKDIFLAIVGIEHKIVRGDLALVFVGFHQCNLRPQTTPKTAETTCQFDWV